METSFNSPLTMMKQFLNWLKTSGVVSITTTATWQTWTSDFWADFEQRIHQQDNKRVAKRLWGCVNGQRQHLNSEILFKLKNL